MKVETFTGEEVLDRALGRRVLGPDLERVSARGLETDVRGAAHAQAVVFVNRRAVVADEGLEVRVAGEVGGDPRDGAVRGDAADVIPNRDAEGAAPLGE